MEYYILRYSVVQYIVTCGTRVHYKMLCAMCVQIVEKSSRFKNKIVDIKEVYCFLLCFKDSEEILVNSKSRVKFKVVCKLCT